MLQLLAGLTLLMAAISRPYLTLELASRCIAHVALAALFAVIVLTYGKRKFMWSILGLNNLIHPFLNFIRAVLVEERLSFVPLPNIFCAL